MRQVLEQIMKDESHRPLVHLEAIKTVSLIISGYGADAIMHAPLSISVLLYH